jgi:FHS family L-fucose permease-like MFS transporter
VLLGVSLGAIVLVTGAITLPGPISGYLLIGVGLMNSIQFPTIFSLACEGLGDRTPDGSGVICVAIVGGAIVPLLTGQVADMAGLRLALWVPVACYALIAGFAILCRRKGTPA